MKQYLDSLKHILENGELTKNRTGVDTISTFGYQMRFDLTKGFPAVTTKKLAWRSVVGELLWFLTGNMNERKLAEITYEKPVEELIDKSTIWTANANEQGAKLGYLNNDTIKLLGPVYGFQWRNFGGAMYNSQPRLRGVDQLKLVIDLLINDPDSRRIILSAWNPQQQELMALPPCHVLSQFRVINGKLSCQLYQRSADMFLGVPFNIASYSLLTFMLAQIANLEVGEFIWTGGDCHIYTNHLDAVRQQLDREPKELPRLIMPAFSSLEELLKTKTSDYQLDGYEPMSFIKADMAV